jgi:hypothetical protein
VAHTCALGTGFTLVYIYNVLGLTFSEERKSLLVSGSIVKISMKMSEKACSLPSQEIIKCANSLHADTEPYVMLINKSLPRFPPPPNSIKFFQINMTKAIDFHMELR